MKGRRKNVQRPRGRKGNQNPENSNPQKKEGKDPVKKASDIVALAGSALTLLERLWEWISKLGQ